MEIISIDNHLTEFSGEVLVEAAQVIDCLHQGHGDKTSFFRHTRVDNYAISTIQIASNTEYETKMFYINKYGQYEPLRNRLTYTSQQEAKDVHKVLVTEVIDRIEALRKDKALRDILQYI